MPKHIITAIGLIVSLGVIALGVVLVALPVYVQAIGVDGQTAAVAELNETYEAQLKDLDAQEDDLDAIDAEVAALRAQIPATAQLDDVFELVGRAAAQSGVTLVSVAVGDQVAFAPRAAGDDTAGEGGAPSATEDGTDSGSAQGTVPDAGSTPAPAEPGGRQQIEIAVNAVAPDVAGSTAFLDALRAGPRLLSSVEVTSQSGDGGVEVQISALTYLDAEG